MAEYLVLIYGDESALGTSDAETSNQMMKGHQVFGERNAAALRGGNALQSTATATSIRQAASGGFVVTDGPFAETKEALGGYYLVEAADLDEALALAKQIPMPFGGVEVRPIGPSTEQRPSPRERGRRGRGRGRAPSRVGIRARGDGARYRGHRRRRGVRSGRIRPGSGHLVEQRHPGPPRGVADHSCPSSRHRHGPPPFDP
jgi:hypothetical protein